jgi:ceramide glucosyltransferase
LLSPNIPTQARLVSLVSILQPILSGDPTLAAGLEQNPTMQTRYPLEFIWLVDDDDLEAQRICRDLLIRYPEKRARLILLLPPGPRQNPKMVKLIAGAQTTSGDVLCVLDDDTRLPAFGLESCLPYLDQPDVGLAFGLTYYVSCNRSRGINYPARRYPNGHT